MTALATPTAVEWDARCESLLGFRTPSILPVWVKLPTLPTVALEFGAKAGDPEATAEELGRIIEKDAGLTGELLRYVNSTTCGFRDCASTAQEAVVRLGTRVTGLYLTTLGLKRLLKSAHWRILDFERFWSANLERALFARETAKLMRADPEVAFAGAILSDCLLPLLTNRAAQTYLRYLNGGAAAASLPEFESAEFGWHHAEATALLMLRWKLPSELVCCVLLHHKGLAVLEDRSLRSTAVAAVAIACLLPDPLRQEPRGLEQLRRLARSWRVFDLVGLAETVQQQFIHVEPAVKNPAPLIAQLAGRAG
jgi:HD-like signal output (HDOD) protein